MIATRIGWLALALAASGWGFLWFAISHANVFCGGGPDDCPSLLGEAPRYVAVFGMVVSATAISVALDRVRVAPRFMSAGAIVLSSVGLVLALAMTLAGYDYMLSSIGSGRLDTPQRDPALPVVVRSVGALWPLFIGGWMTLASLQLVRIGLPFAIAALGVITGFAIVVTLPFGGEWFVYTSILPLELICSLVWATAVGVYFTTPRRIAAPA